MNLLNDLVLQIPIKVSLSGHFIIHAPKENYVSILSVTYGTNLCVTILLTFSICDTRLPLSLEFELT